MMKKMAPVRRSTTSKLEKSPAKRSSISRSARNLGKKSLRSILLSHTFHTGVRLALISIFIFVPFYGVYAYLGKTVANEIVVSKSQIIERVRELTTLPAENPEAVVRVQDAESLKRQNPFYNKVKSGDYIVMYKTLAIIYDLRNDEILAIKNINEVIR
ncbi:MAG: hypothetical protein NTW35_02890 [Candidatus Nomurabacteria bacterium]|nr:hypothetical protein [Candidatus Nomurabacteria bacterium]